MTTLTVRGSGAAVAATAWQRYEQIGLWTTWAPQLRRVERSAERLAPGVRGRVVGPLGVSVRFEVDDVDATRMTWAWRVRRTPVTVRLVHGIVPHDTGCRTWLQITGPLPVVLAYAPVAAVALRRLVAP